MADQSKEYRAADGFIQFEPNEREAAGKQVRDITIRQSGAGGQKIRATIWPDFADVELNKGDFVALEGRYSKNTVEKDDGPVTYHNISVVRLVRFPSVSSAPPEVVNAQDDGEEEPF